MSWNVGNYLDLCYVQQTCFQHLRQIGQICLCFMDEHKKNRIMVVPL